ncbi:unnamed protein product, partial [Ectocarpus sp. 12 AP-2014]
MKLFAEALLLVLLLLLYHPFCVYLLISSEYFYHHFWGSSLLLRRLLYGRSAGSKILLSFMRRIPSWSRFHSSLFFHFLLCRCYSYSPTSHHQPPFTSIISSGFVDIFLRVLPSFIS